jgi:hypothetical protein
MPIAYGSKKQAWVARSSFESELGGACRGGGVARHICQILSGMGIMLELPIPVYIDNEGVVNGLSNVTHETSAKHIDTRMFWLKNDITFNIFELMHVQSADNLADVMTKPLTIGPFRKLIDDIIGIMITEAGRRMRRGEYAYDRAVLANRNTVRPKVSLFIGLPGPPMGEYYEPGTVLSSWGCFGRDPLRARKTKSPR